VVNFIDRAYEVKVPKYVLEQDPFYKEVHPHLQKEPETIEISISCCISCSLSSSIPEGTTSSKFSLPPTNKLACIASQATKDIDYNENAIDDTMAAISKMVVSSSSSSTEVTKIN